jgi:hypothetical protein
VVWAKDDVVSVVEHHRPGKPGSSVKGAKVHGGVARVLSFDAATRTADLHFYLEGRRAKTVEWTHLRASEPPAEASAASGVAVDGADGGVAVEAGGSIGGGGDISSSSSSSRSSSSTSSSEASEPVDLGAALPGPARFKAVERYDAATGDVLEEYAPGVECAAKLGLTANEVSDAVRGKGKPLPGYQFRFKFDVPLNPVPRERQNTQAGHKSGITHEGRAALEAATLARACSKRERKPAQAIEVSTGPAAPRGPKGAAKSVAKGGGKFKASPPGNPAGTKPGAITRCFPGAKLSTGARAFAHALPTHASAESIAEVATNPKVCSGANSCYIAHLKSRAVTGAKALSSRLNSPSPSPVTDACAEQAADARVVTIGSQTPTLMPSRQPPLVPSPMPTKRSIPRPNSVPTLLPSPAPTRLLSPLPTNQPTPVPRPTVSCLLPTPQPAPLSFPARPLLRPRAHAAANTPPVTGTVAVAHGPRERLPACPLHCLV